MPRSRRHALILILSLAVLDICLIVARTIAYRGLLSQPGTAGALVEAVAVIAVAAALALLFHRRQPDSLRSGFRAGVAGGSLLVAHMALEDFGSRIGEDGPLTLAFMGAAFAVWALAGFRAARSTGRLSAGALAGCSAGIVSVLMVVVFGHALLFAHVPSADYVATWPEYRRSGWFDPVAYMIVDAMGDSVSHVLTGIIIGALTGFFGGIAGAASGGATHRPRGASAH